MFELRTAVVALMAALLGCQGAVDAEGSESTSTSTSTSSGTSASSTEDTSPSGDGDGDLATGDGDGDSGSACGNTPAWPPPSVADDGYQRFELCGWTVYMSEALHADALAEPVYLALAEDLDQVTQLLPPPTSEFLRATNFWMELELEDFPGGVYHPSPQWLSDNGYPPKWGQGIQFGVAQNYLDWVAQQPAMVLHELTHAWDHQHHGYAQPDIVAAYEAAMAAELYAEVEYVAGGTQEAYATTNAAEYFAELSEAYFATGEPPEGWFNDFYPFTRAQLLAHDPVGHAAIEAAWELE